ncbi:hypothetical protein BpHYR1_043644 [Brachionus plicatilis]|uniref:Transmembrane protein n=1 Tax=Brachionus plicatilis TaxID=10195 RepID=A0A3M7SU22_BRAPC|nr:hypothetical protein BpHYR1_043644 [Brachionus plicatilis]
MRIIALSRQVFIFLNFLYLKLSISIILASTYEKNDEYLHSNSLEYQIIHIIDPFLANKFYVLSKQCKKRTRHHNLESDGCFVNNLKLNKSTINKKIKMEILQEFILKTEEAINLLENNKQEIEQPLERIYQNSNMVRTVGTSVSTAGAGLFVGALLLAPGGQFWRSMRVQSLAMRKVLSSLGVNVSRKAAMGFIRGGTVVLSTVFVYFDVKSLIECWKSKHPNMAQVEEIIKKFKEELDRTNRTAGDWNALDDDPRC